DGAGGGGAGLEVFRPAGRVAGEGGRSGFVRGLVLVAGLPTEPGLRRQQEQAARESRNLTVGHEEPLEKESTAERIPYDYRAATGGIKRNAGRSALLPPLLSPMAVDQLPGRQTVGRL